MRSQTLRWKTTPESDFFTPLFLLTSQLLEECQLISVPRGLGNASQLCSFLPHSQEAFGERIRSSQLPQRQPAPLSSLRFKSELCSPLQGLISAPRLVEQQKWRILASLGLLFLSYSAGKQSPAWFSNWIKTNCSAGFDPKHSAFQQCDLT